MAEPGSSPYINHFIQPDTIIPNPYNPQDFNRYAYVRNNPIRYTDPSGHAVCTGPYDSDCYHNGNNWDKHSAVSYMKGWATGGGAVQSDHGINIDIELPDKFVWGYIDTKGAAYDPNGAKYWGITRDIGDIRNWKFKGFDTGHLIKDGTVYLTDASLNYLNHTDLLAIMGHEAHHAWQNHYARTGEKGPTLTNMKNDSSREPMLQKCPGCFSYWAEPGGYQVQLGILNYLSALDVSQLRTIKSLDDAKDFYENSVPIQTQNDASSIDICEPICEIR